MKKCILLFGLLISSITLASSQKCVDAVNLHNLEIEKYGACLNTFYTATDAYTACYIRLDKSGKKIADQMQSRCSLLHKNEGTMHMAFKAQCALDSVITLLKQQDESTI